METFTTLSCSSGQNAVDSINKSCSKAQLFEEEDFVSDGVLEDHDYSLLFSMSNLSDFSVEIFNYVAGFVARQLLKKIMSEDCREVLTSHQKLSKLVVIKSKGRLVTASRDVINICIKTEETFRRYIKEKGRYKINSSTVTSMISHVLAPFLHKSVFVTLSNHCLDQSFDHNHMLNLIRAVASTYLNLRLFYEGENQYDKP